MIITTTLFVFIHTMYYTLGVNYDCFVVYFAKEFDLAGALSVVLMVALDYCGIMMRL